MASSQEILAENLNALLDFEEKRPTQLELKARADAKNLTISQSTISRVLRAKVNIDLYTLDALAILFETDPWRLLAPNLGGVPFHQLRIGGRTLPGPAPDERVSKFIDPAPPEKPKPEPAPSGRRRRRAKA